MLETILMCAVGYVLLGGIWTLGWRIALGPLSEYPGSGGIGVAFLMYLPWIWPFLLIAMLYSLVKHEPS